MDYDMLFISIIILILLYYICNVRKEMQNMKGVIKEEFNTINDADAIKNLASIATKTMATGGFIVPGNINFPSGVRSRGTPIGMIGTIIPYAGATAPNGWLICDGNIAAMEYTELRSLLGSTFGAPGKLPNLTKRVIIGVGQGEGLTNRMPGNTGGAETVALSVKEMPSHKHSIDSKEHSHTYEIPSRNGNHECSCGRTGGCKDVPNLDGNGRSPPAGKHSHTMINAGSGTVHDNMMPYVTINYIIRAK
jgi:microcystin-dependent protein